MCHAEGRSQPVAPMTIAQKGSTRYDFQSEGLLLGAAAVSSRFGGGMGAAAPRARARLSLSALIAVCGRDVAGAVIHGLAMVAAPDQARYGHRDRGYANQHDEQTRTETLARHKLSELECA